MIPARMKIDASPTSRPSQTFPTRQGVFFTSGCIAGTATIPVGILWSHLAEGSGRASWLSHLPPKSLAATTIFRAGTRFGIFDVTRTFLDARIPILNPSRSRGRTACIGGLSSASGGLAEVMLSSVLAAQPKVPTLRAMAAQSSKLFFCFGTYPFISTTYAKDLGLPPKPFPVALAMGATAGCVGSAIMAAVEGARGAVLRKSAIGGALVIGTVISVHVTVCAAMLRGVDG